jgi:hypothetical protein
MQPVGFILLHHIWPLLPVYVVVAVALRQAFFSIRRLGRGHCGGAMVAGDAPGQVETVIAWSGGRRLHLLTWRLSRSASCPERIQFPVASGPVRPSNGVFRDVTVSSAMYCKSVAYRV